MTYADGEISVKRWEYAKGSRSFFGSNEIASLEITNRRVVAETNGKSSMSRTEMDLDTIQSVNLDYRSGSVLGVILMVIGILVAVGSVVFGGMIISAVGAVFIAIGFMLLGKKVKIIFYLTACPNGFISVRKGRRIKRGYRTIKVNKVEAEDIIETLGAYLLEVKKI